MFPGQPAAEREGLAMREGVRSHGIKMQQAGYSFDTKGKGEGL